MFKLNPDSAGYQQFLPFHQCLQESSSPRVIKTRNLCSGHHKNGLVVSTYYLVFNLGEWFSCLPDSLYEWQLS